jgi:predicted DNA-binding protein YlxM (UPF0122 family)
MDQTAKLILTDREEMYKLYITQNLSLKSIANLLNVSVWSVREYLNKKHGIYKSEITDPKHHVTKLYLSNKEW